jgi:membrane-associated phospholipid phosphatase
MTETTVEEPAATRRRWQLPRQWRERTDWVSTDTVLGQFLRGARWGAVAVYLVVLVREWSDHGIPFDRTGLLLWIAIGLGCLCIGRHPVWLLWVVVDFLPLAAVLIAYDRLRGWSYTVGMPTWWHPQIDVDKWLFFGRVPTVWLQEHLKQAQVQWYDVVVCICYYSFFFLPYLTAGVLWVRGRTHFYRWVGRFVALSFIGFALFVLIPAAPPWAAARCTSAQVAGHPNNPACMYWSPRFSHNGLLGPYSGGHAGTNQWVDSGIATRGFSKLHLTVAEQLVEHGRGWGDAVAAVPSLHVGGTVLFVLFAWSRVRKWWKPLLVVYPFLMMFSLAYGAEHYVSDGIAGALAAWLVHWVATRIERRRAERRGAEDRTDTLEPPPDPTLETSCPPTQPPPVTTPSST